MTDRLDLVPPLLARLFFFSNQLNKSWLLVAGAGGVVGEGEHFPALRSEAGEAEPIARRAIVHKSTGAKAHHSGKIQFLLVQIQEQNIVVESM